MPTGDMLERLRRHYLKPGSLPGGVFVTEVGQNGGIDGTTPTRRCDAMHIGFTSSSGRLLTGHEVKVSRSDWLRELAQPDKADVWADQCHAWYVVAPSAEVVVPGELPPDWGLMTINPRTRTRLDVAVAAHVHRDRQPAWWAVRSIFARFDTLTWTLIEDRVRTGTAHRLDELDRAAKAHAQHSQSSEAVLAGKLHDALRGRPLWAGDDEIVAALRSLLTSQRVAHDARADVEGLLRHLGLFTDAITDLSKRLREATA